MSTNPKDAIGLTKPQLHLVPPALCLHVSQAMADGAKKYGAYNWRERDVRLTVYIAAAMRHLFSLLDGEDCARDSGVLHAAHVAACMAIILDAKETGNLVDDRPTKGCAADLIEKLTLKPAVDAIEPLVNAELTRRTGGTYVVPIDFKVTVDGRRCTLEDLTRACKGALEIVDAEIDDDIADTLDDAALDAPIPYWVKELPTVFREGDVVTWCDEEDEGIVDTTDERSSNVVWKAGGACFHLNANLRLVRRPVKVGDVLRSTLTSFLGTVNAVDGGTITTVFEDGSGGDHHLVAPCGETRWVHADGTPIDVPRPFCGAV